jgi:hypothetical protein
VKSVVKLKVIKGKAKPRNTSRNIKVESEKTIIPVAKPHNAKVKSIVKPSVKRKPIVNKEVAVTSTKKKVSNVTRNRAKPTVSTTSTTKPTTKSYQL